MVGKSKRDPDALLVPLAHRKRQNDEVAFNHVAKKALKNKSLEVVFDPRNHKDFITGFRKRKQQRRKQAQEIIKKKEREQRLQDRADRRAKLKEELKLDDNWGVSEDEEKSTEPEIPDVGTGNVSVYEQQGTRTVVAIAPLSMHSDSEQEEEDDDDNQENNNQDHDQINAQTKGKPGKVKQNQKGGQKAKPKASSQQPKKKSSGGVSKQKSHSAGKQKGKKGGKKGKR